MATHVVKQVDGPSSGKENKFLTFSMAQENYGVEILRVREIIGLIDITPLPQTPNYVRGVINLRGKIIPVIELRTKFGMTSVEYTEETCVIVVEVSEVGISERFEMGVIVDRVNEVLDINESSIEPAPRFGCSMNTDFILGMAKVKMAERDRVIILLNIDHVLTTEELNSLSNNSSTANMSASEITELDQGIDISTPQPTAA